MKRGPNSSTGWGTVCHVFFIFFELGNAAILHHARVCRFAPRHFGRFTFLSVTDVRIL